MIDLTQVFGWIGSILLACCGLPLLVGAIRDRSIARNISMAFLQAWLWGEIFVAAYAVLLGDELRPVLFNVSMNIVCILGILWLRWSQE